MIVGALVGLLVTAAVIGAVGSFRAHSAYRESLRELRDGDRRLEPGTPGRRLEDELRWYADVSAATRDAGWRPSAAVAVALCALAFVPGIWALTSAPALTVGAVVVLLVAAVLVGGLAVLDGRRSEGLLRSAARRSALGNVRRLEDSLVAVHRTTLALRATRRTWLRTRAATYPLASVVASVRQRAYERSAARRARAVSALARSVPVSLSGLSVRAPDGYAEGLRGLTPLAGGGPVDDDTWAAAVADLSQAAERDTPRRARWLSALAACAELRSDAPARESAARWALDAAALPGRAVGDSRTDPLPDALAFEPVRPGTWDGALRRARLNNAGPILLAEVTLRWAYALVDAAPNGADPRTAHGSARGTGSSTGSGTGSGSGSGDGFSGGSGDGSAPGAGAGTGLDRRAGSNGRTFLGRRSRGTGATRAGASTPTPEPTDPHGATRADATDTTGPTGSGASLFEPRTPGPNVPRPNPLIPAARDADDPTEIIPTARDAADRIPADMTAAPPGPLPAGSAGGPAAALEPAVTAAAEIMTETTDPDEYLRRVRPGFESLGATSVQLSRLVPTWHAPASAPTP